MITQAVVSAPFDEAVAFVGEMAGAQLASEKRFRFDGTEFWLKSATEMRQLFAEVPEACGNTLLVA